MKKLWESKKTSVVKGVSLFIIVFLFVGIVFTNLKKEEYSLAANINSENVYQSNYSSTYYRRGSSHHSSSHHSSSRHSSSRHSSSRHSSSRHSSSRHRSRSYRYRHNRYNRNTGTGEFPGWLAMLFVIGIPLILIIAVIYFLIKIIKGRR